MVKLSELNEVNHYNGLSPEKEEEIIREKKRIMDLVPDKITEDEDKAMMDTKLPLAVHLRHKGLVNALNHLKGIILADITPKYFYELSRFKDISSKQKSKQAKYIADKLSSAISAYNDGYSHRDFYSEHRSDISSFYRDNPGLIKSILPEVIEAYGLDQFENFAHIYHTELYNQDKSNANMLSLHGYTKYGGGRIGKSRSSKKRSIRLRRKSTKRKSTKKNRSKSLRRHRRRTFRK